MAVSTYDNSNTMTDIEGNPLPRRRRENQQSPVQVTSNGSTSTKPRTPQNPGNTPTDSKGLIDTIKTESQKAADKQIDKANKAKADQGPKTPWAGKSVGAPTSVGLDIIRDATKLKGSQATHPKQAELDATKRRGGKTQEQYNAETQKIRDEAERLRKENDATASQNRRDEGKLGAVDAWRRGERPHHSTIHPDDQKGWMGGGTGQVGISDPQAGTIDYTGVIPPELQALMSTDRDVADVRRVTTGPDAPPSVQPTTIPDINPEDMAALAANPLDTVAMRKLKAAEDAQEDLIDQITGRGKYAEKGPRGKYADVMPPDLEAGKDARDDRIAAGRQYKKDAIEARSRGLTPQDIANERKMLGLANQQKQAELEAATQAQSVERYKQAVELMEGQKQAINDQLKKLDKDASADDITPAQKVEIQNKKSELYGQLLSTITATQKAKAMQLLVGIDPKDVRNYQQYSDPKMAQWYQDAYGMTPDQMLDAKYGPGTAYAFKVAYPSSGANPTPPTGPSTADIADAGGERSVRPAPTGAIDQPERQSDRRKDR